MTHNYTSIITHNDSTFQEQEDGELSDGEINSPEPMDITGKVK